MIHKYKTSLLTYLLILSFFPFVDLLFQHIWDASLIIIISSVFINNRLYYTNRKPGPEKRSKQCLTHGKVAKRSPIFTKSFIFDLISSIVISNEFYYLNRNVYKKDKTTNAKMHNHSRDLGYLQTDLLEFQFCNITTLGFLISEIDPSKYIFYQFC